MPNDRAYLAALDAEIALLQSHLHLLEQARFRHLAFLKIADKVRSPPMPAALMRQLSRRCFVGGGQP